MIDLDFFDQFLGKLNMDTNYLDKVLETLCEQGCQKVSIILQQLKDKQCPNELKQYTQAECTYLYEELAAIMAVYGNEGCCSL